MFSEEDSQDSLDNLKKSGLIQGLGLNVCDNLTKKIMKPHGVPLYVGKSVSTVINHFFSSVEIFFLRKKVMKGIKGDIIMKLVITQSRKIGVLKERKREFF